MFKNEKEKINNKINKIVEQNDIDSEKINNLKKEEELIKKAISVKSPLAWFMSNMIIPTIYIAMFIMVISTKALNLNILSLGSIIISLGASATITALITNKVYKKRCESFIKKYPEFNLSRSIKELKKDKSSVKRRIEQIKNDVYDREYQLEDLTISIASLNQIEKVVNQASIEKKEEICNDKIEKLENMKQELTDYKDIHLNELGDIPKVKIKK